MGMHGESDILGDAVHFNRKAHLGNQVSGIGPDDAAADDLLCCRVKE